jgi:hypothetical protein
VPAGAFTHAGTEKGRVALPLDLRSKPMNRYQLTQPRWSLLEVECNFFEVLTSPL